MDNKTGLPETISFSDAFDGMELSPSEFHALITGMAQPHAGGANDALYRKLNAHANRLVDAQTWKDRNVVSDSAPAV